MFKKNSIKLLDLFIINSFLKPFFVRNGKSGAVKEYKMRIIV